MMIEGVEITMSGRTFTVPPLNFKRAKKALVLLAKINDQSFGEEALSAASEFVHLALTRNYPDLQLDEVEELLDLKNLGGIIQTIMEVSGFAKPGEAQPGSH